LSFLHTFCKTFYALNSNSYISTPIENWTRVYMNLFTRDSPYYNCCVLRGSDGESILDIVPSGTELGAQVKTGRWAGRTHSQ